jgi:hypothetical protein
MGDADLYDYPSEHVGRRHYVTVRGHTRSIPSYKTYKGSDGHYHLHPDFGGSGDFADNGSFYYLPDKQSYVSPLDGSTITSRSQHREHMIRHGVIEAGDMPVGHMNGAKRGPDLTPAGYSVADVLRKEGWMG